MAGSAMTGITTARSAQFTLEYIYDRRHTQERREMVVRHAGYVRRISARRFGRRHGQPRADSISSASGASSPTTRPTMRSGRGRRWTSCSRRADDGADADRARPVRSGRHLRIPALFEVLAQKKRARRSSYHMIIGPWFHGQDPGHTKGSAFGQMQCSNAHGHFRRKVMLPFFEQLLCKDAPKPAYAAHGARF